MDSERDLQERLKQLAENVRFRHYVVCPLCGAPVVLSTAEAEGRHVRIQCESCHAAIDFDPARVRPHPG